MSYALSNHATVRLQQRGVRRQLIAALMTHADFEASVGRGCSVLRMSSDQLDNPEGCASIGHDRERLRQLSIVWSERTGEIVTVLRPRRGQAGRRYCKGNR